MQSVYKLPIAMAVLNQVDRGALSLDQNVRVEKEDLVGAGQHSPVRDKTPNGGVELSVRELLRFMVSESDGSACDVLLRVVGGPGRVTAFLNQLSLKAVVVANTEKEMGRDEQVQYRNWASPNAMLRLLRAVHEGPALSAPSRTYLLQLMTETGTGPNRIKGMLPAGTVVAHKTGTSGTHNGFTRATNDVGIVTLPNGQHMAVAVFVSDSAVDTTVREGTIAKLARAAWDHWSSTVHK
jgi:beta-lactamase class A